MSAPLVRPVARDDYDQWLPLWNGYNEFYGRHGDTALDPAITATTWERFFDAYEPVHALVVEEDGQLVGLAHYLFHRSTTSIAPICYLQDLFADSGSRGTGVGARLIRAVYARAEAAGCQRAYWQTHKTNHLAMRLYDHIAEQSGFLVYRKIF